MMKSAERHHCLIESDMDIQIRQERQEDQAVRTDWQRKGVGKLLVTTGHELARRLGYSCSVVLGDPMYYSKLGYEKASSYGVIAPFDVPDEYYMACDLGKNDDIPKGCVKYSDVFGI